MILILAATLSIADIKADNLKCMLLDAASYSTQLDAAAAAARHDRQAAITLLRRAKELYDDAGACSTVVDGEVQTWLKAHGLLPDTKHPVIQS